MSAFVTLTFETTLGSKYVIPDVEPKAASDLVASLPRFADAGITNASGACLIIPSRILAAVSVDGEVRWRR